MSKSIIMACSPSSVCPCASICVCVCVCKAKTDCEFMCAGWDGEGHARLHTCARDAFFRTQACISSAETENDEL